MAPVIPKQTKKERDQITIRLDRDVLKTLEHYCRYLESGWDYVINKCLAFIFRKDKPFAMWLAQQGGPSSPAVAVPSEESAPLNVAHRKEKNGAVQGRLAITEEVSK
jgi:hypothetical protein